METPHTAPKHASTVEPAADDARYQRASALAARAPVPARSGRILAGTAGWTDPSLSRGALFYPRGTASAEQRLRFYSAQFPLVEVDASYYALPSAATAQGWTERTPPGFIFNIKAFAMLTQHPVDVVRLPADLRDALPQTVRAARRAYPKDLPEEVRDAIWDRFRRAVDPLKSAGRLGCILFQFPPWFTATRGNARIIEDCRARLEGYPLAAELRHASWGEPARLERLIALLRGIEASYVIVDEPQGKKNSMPPAIRVADPQLAVIRFHGRRDDTWDTRASVAERFDYLYDPRELKPWAQAVEQLAQDAEQVHLVFNNCVSNHAVLGAKGLMALLAGEPAPGPR